MCRIDYEATVKAANDAQNSAQIAQNNAAEAAVKASLSTVHDAASGHGVGSSAYHGSEQGGHGGHLDAYGSQKTLTVASAQGSQHQQQQQQSTSSNGHSGENKSGDSTARSSNHVKSSAPTSSEIIASNHNYGGNHGKEFKPSAQYSYAGY